MLSRRKVLAAMGILAGWGCHKAPELPPASEFLKDIQIMDRDGKALPNEWIVSQANPVDPTIQFEAVAPPTVLGERKVLPADQWIIVVNVLDENDKSRWCSIFRKKNNLRKRRLATNKVRWCGSHRTLQNLCPKERSGNGVIAGIPRRDDIHSCLSSTPRCFRCRILYASITGKGSNSFDKP